MTLPSHLQPIVVDARARRDLLRDKTTVGLKGLFPLIGRDHELHVEDVRVKPAAYSSNDQKAAILHGRSLLEPVVGTLTLRDKVTGAVVDTKKNHILAHLPYFTERHTMIVGGNEYELPNQLRLKSGVFTRERDNGEFEASFNLSKGENFRLAMEPESGKLHAEFGSSKIPLYPLLKALGVPDTDMKRHWGAELLSANKASGGKTSEDTVLNKLVTRFKRPSEAMPSTPEAKKQYIHDYFARTAMDPTVNERTLGQGFTTASPLSMLTASERLISVHKGDHEGDDRDSLEFKTLHSADDFFKERLEKDARRSIAPKLVWKMNQNKSNAIKDFVPNSTFTRSLTSFLTNSTIAAIPQQINPVEIIDHASKVTSLGEGGITSDRAIPMESRKIHGTQLGIMDPVRTPECYDDQTEVLTRTGWALWKDVPADAEFACRVEGRLEYHKALARFAAPYTGIMHQVCTPRIEYSVTPNHRVFWRNKAPKSPWKFTRADELSATASVFDTGHLPERGVTAVTTFTLPQLEGVNVKNVGPIAINDWAELLGWFFAEGYATYAPERTAYRTDISQSTVKNPEKCARLEALFERLPFAWNCRQGVCYEIGGKQLAHYLHQFGTSYEKSLPAYVFDMPVEARTLLWEALFLGDGNGCTRESAQEYYTASPQLARDVERLLISLGYAARVDPFRKDADGNVTLHRVVRYKVRFRNVRLCQDALSTVEYSGNVYCATVPGGLLYVRRNGKIPLWSGNSFHAGIDIRAAIGASKDAAGNLHGTFLNAASGVREHVPVTTLAKSTIGFSGQEHRKGHVDALRGVDVVSVPRSQVDYYVEDPTHMFSPTTALVPLLDSMQGNRALMSSKFGTQSLPLLTREVPYVQSAAPRKGQSMEQELARMIVPTSPVHGTVEKIDGDFIYIRPHAEKTSAIDYARALGRMERRQTGTETPEERAEYAAMNDSELLSMYDGAEDAQIPGCCGEDAKLAAAKPAKDPHEGLVRLSYDTNFPLASKTYLHNTVTAKVGDTVKPGDMLADSNFTRDGHVALGKNLSVAYMSWYGKNSNDAVVISEDASKKLTSEHMYKETLRRGPDTITSKAKYSAYYGMKYTAAQLGKLDDKGVALPGKVFEPGDPLILALEPATASPEAVLLGSLHKSLVKPFRDATIVWEHHTPGEVVDAALAARQTVVTVRTHEQMKVGDKLANRFGGKGVISEIVPNGRMIHDEAGKPVDVIFTSAGVVSRINPGQIVEGALGKVVEKTGKPIVLPQFQREDNVQFAKNLLKEHGLKDKETVHDPISGRSIPGVFVGRSYIYKLFKTTESNYAARGVTSYDINLQPTKGGEEGAKGLGKMEINALLAHNARNVLKEALTTKSEKSDEYWRALEFGLPPPPPKTPFVTEKFNAMLKGAGINVDKRGTTVGIHALTDKHVMDMSSGALTLPELDKSKSFMVTAKNLKPEKGGLFDPVLTGGLSGTRWSHIELPEPVLSPVFEDPARRLLGMTKAQINQLVADEGGAGVKKRLNKLDLNSLETSLTEKTRTVRASALDDVVKQLKYVRALKANGQMKAGDAYVVTKIPVIPPIMRPILPSQKNGELQISDSNYLYRDLALAASGLKAAHEVGLPSLVSQARTHLYDASAALSGIGEPVSPQLQGRGVKGFIAQVTGQGSPKTGFLFKKVLKRQQDLSGRATATPDNTLDMDQIGVPEDMLWTTYNKFVMKGLIGQGISATRAAEMATERHPAAQAVLNRELTNRPVFINRAPSLHKHNFVAAYPVSVPGKTLRVNPFMEKGMTLDYDGDTMQLHVPISASAVAEAKELTLSKLLFGDKSRDDLMIFPQHEAIIGAYLATRDKHTGPKKTFASKADALAAYKRGEISLDTHVEIKA